MTRRHLSYLIPVLLLAAFVAPAPGQQQAPRFLNLVEVDVKLDSMPQWEAYVKKVIEAAEKTGSQRYWMTLQVAHGGRAATFFVTMPFDEMGDLDGYIAPPRMVLEAFGPEEGAAILKTGLASIESVQLETYTLLEDFTTHYDASRYGARFYRVIRTRVKPHMNSTYRSLLARGSAVAKAREDGPMTIRRSVMIGPSFRYLAASPFESWAEDRGPGLDEIMAEEWGEETTRDFFETLNRCIEERETLVIERRPELSRPGN